jgi:hypothetical protein
MHGSDGRPLLEHFSLDEGPFFGRGHLTPGVIAPTAEGSRLADRAGPPVHGLEGFLIGSPESGRESAPPSAHGCARGPDGRTHAPTPGKGEEGEANGGDVDKG